MAKGLPISTRGVKQKSRLRKRAESEATIVGFCARRTDELIREAKEKIAESKGEIAIKEQELVALFNQGSSEIEIEILNSDISTVEMNLKQLERTSLMLIDVHKTFKELQYNVQLAMSFGWYRYIIRLIPEKKLPNMIVSEDPEDLAKVMTIIENINNRIVEKIVVSKKDRAEGGTIIDRTNAYADKQIAKIRADGGKEVDANTGIGMDAMERIKRAMAKKGTVPVDAKSNEETADNQNANRA